MLKLWMAFFIFMMTSMLWALPDDRSQPARLTANTADLNQETHTGVYTGDVQFDQGSSHLRANKAITHATKENKISSAFAYGTKNTPAHYWEQTALDKPPIHAYAIEIHYDATKHRIDLIGEARVVQGEDSFTAPQISYDTLTKQIIAKADKSARPQIIFHRGNEHG